MSGGTSEQGMRDPLISASVSSSSAKSASPSLREKTPSVQIAAVNETVQSDEEKKSHVAAAVSEKSHSPDNKDRAGNVSNNEMLRLGGKSPTLSVGNPFNTTSALTNSFSGCSEEVEVTFSIATDISKWTVALKSSEQIPRFDEKFKFYEPSMKYLYFKRVEFLNSAAWALFYRTFFLPW
jgi:hypothetical protein